MENASRLPGRRAEAIANDARVLTTARAVLTVAPETPMAVIAARAGVGIGSLYRRFPSKEALAYRLCLDGMNALIDVAREALAASDEDPWEVFMRFMRGSVQAGAGALRGLAGTFVPDERLNRVAGELGALVGQVLERAQAAGAVRDDVNANDIGMIWEMLRAIRVGDGTRSDELRGRYLELLAPALRAPAAGELSVPAPSWAEISASWNP
jgi:AcrR family transcriptional regulator